MTLYPVAQWCPFLFSSCFWEGFPFNSTNPKRMPLFFLGHWGESYAPAPRSRWVSSVQGFLWSKMLGKRVVGGRRFPDERNLFAPVGNCGSSTWCPCHLCSMFLYIMFHILSYISLIFVLDFLQFPVMVSLCSLCFPNLQCFPYSICPLRFRICPLAFSSDRFSSRR